MKRQNLLYDALDAVAPKAADEASSALGRMFQTLNLKAPTTALGKSATISALVNNPLMGGGALMLSPLFLMHHLTLTGLRNPTLAKFKDPIARSLANFNAEMRKIGKTIKDPKVRNQLYKDVGVIDTLIHTYESGAKDGES